MRQAVSRAVGLAALGFALVAPSPARAITRDDVLARAQAWVDASVPYSWDAWYTDPTTGECCYRSDCSGLISAVWGLPAPGETTYSLAGGPWDSGVSHLIDAADLLPGDALNYPGDPGDGTGHVMLYVDGDFWSGTVYVYEEYSHGHDATLRWRDIDPSIYLPIRFDGIEDCTTETCDGKDDDCDGAVDEDWVCEAPDEPALSAWRQDPVASTDVDGDGRADACARGVYGFQCHLSSGDTFAEGDLLPDLSDAAGYATIEAASSLRMADVDGDGRADVCARDAVLGFGCWLSTGTGWGARIAGPALTDALGWGDASNADSLRMLDVDGDRRADLCARADSGVLCWLSDGAGFPTRIAGPAWSDALGWDDPQYADTIRAADINGDGRDDLCARGVNGVDCRLSDGAGFPTAVDGPPLTNELGWNNEQYYTTIAMPDLNGDGRADLCARGAAVVYCWPSTGGGFGDTLTGPALADSAGWNDLAYNATLRWGDVTGDGLDDLCARDPDGVRCWPSTGTGFGEAIAGPALRDADGWGDYPNFSTIDLADIDGDGRADLCARADAGLRCWRADGDGFGGSIAGPEWSDALGWDDVLYGGTLRLAGGLGVSPNDTGDTGDTGAGADSGGDTASADSGAPGAPGGSGAAKLTADGGCGCENGPATAAGWLGVLAAALLGRRRR